MVRGRDSGIRASYLECFNCQEYTEHPNAHALLYQNGFITITYDQHVFCKLHIRVVYGGRPPKDDTY